MLARTNELLHQCCIEISELGDFLSGNRFFVCDDAAVLAAGTAGQYDSNLTENDELFAARECRTPNVLNVFLVPRAYRGNPAQEILGLTAARPQAGPPFDRRIVIIPMDYGVSGNDADLYGPSAGNNKGDRFQCTQVLAHEIGHALSAFSDDTGLHPGGDTASDRPDVFDPNIPPGTATTGRRVMAGGVARQPRFCDPTHLRFSMQARRGDPNECARMRTRVAGLGTTYSFNE